MTAHAMDDDRERCLAAGMDDYLSKPLRQEKLIESVVRLTRQDDAETSQAKLDSERGAPSDTLVDAAAALAGLEGDRGLLAEIAAIFLDDTDKVLERMRSAIEAGDIDDLRLAAHNLKGSVSNFCAKRVEKTVVALEETACSGDLPAVSRAFDDLQQELAHLQPELATLAEEKQL